MEKTKKWRWGINRWWVFLFIGLSVFFATKYPPIRPGIFVVPENVIARPLFGNFYLTNSLVGTLIVDIVLILIALAVRSAAKSGSLVPKGVSGAIEALLEVIYNLTESTAGKWTKSIFPIFATITLLVLCSNWLEMFPGVESIGRLHEGEHGYPTVSITQNISAIVKGEGAHAEGDAEVVPFVRVPSTDLNFTLSLALVSVVMTQVIGFRAQGARYFTKFLNFTTLFKKPGFGLMDLLISVLELISEFSKILSFSFRLFGNIFAGSVLLFLVGSILPAGAVWIQSGVLLFEFFIGLIQALVFGMLTMVFMSMATHGHGGEEEHAAA